MMTLDEFLAAWNDDNPTILVHTSGSTGTPKPLWVEKRRMLNSARVTCDFLGLRRGDTALLCMPLDYIAGKMMVVRSIERQLRLVSVTPSGHPLRTLREAPCFAAMVPMQVYSSLQVPAEKALLREIRHLIIGGGAINEALADALKDFPHAVWSTYGMTETLSHIALRRLNGEEASDWYTPFEGVGVKLNDEGCLVITAPEVCPEPVVTNDIAQLAPDGRFRVIGRRDNVICSGGIKVQIEEVEAALRPYLNAPFAITKVPDEKLGEAVTLLTESRHIDETSHVCATVLPRYWVPRHYRHVDRIPLTATGKIARAETERLAILLAKA